MGHMRRKLESICNLDDSSFFVGIIIQIIVCMALKKETTDLKILQG
jgi:hypothetical protein